MKFEEYTAWSFPSLLSLLHLHSLFPKTVLPNPIEFPARASPKDNRVLQYRSPGSIPVRARHRIHTCAAANVPIWRPSFATFHVQSALCRSCRWHMPHHHKIHECLSSRSAQTSSVTNGLFEALLE